MMQGSGVFLVGYTSKLFIQINSLPRQLAAIKWSVVYAGLSLSLAYQAKLFKQGCKRVSCLLALPNQKLYFGSVGTDWLWLQSSLPPLSSVFLWIMNLGWCKLTQLLWQHCWCLFNSCAVSMDMYGLMESSYLLHGCHCMQQRGTTTSWIMASLMLLFLNEEGLMQTSSGVFVVLSVLHFTGTNAWRQVLSLNRMGTQRWGCTCGNPPCACWRVLFDELHGVSQHQLWAELAPHRAAWHVCTTLHLFSGAFPHGHNQTVPTSAPALHALMATYTQFDSLNNKPGWTLTASEGFASSTQTLFPYAQRSTCLWNTKSASTLENNTNVIIPVNITQPWSVQFSKVKWDF